MSSSSSDSDSGPVPKKVVRKVVLKKVVKKDATKDASPGLSADQRASLIMARANAAKKGHQRSLSSDDSDGPRLPKLPGQAGDSSDTSDDDVVVPVFGLEAEGGRNSQESAEAQKALKEIQAIRDKRIALQKGVFWVFCSFRLSRIHSHSLRLSFPPSTADRLAGASRKLASSAKGPTIAPPPGGVSSSSSEEESDDDAEMLPNGVEETWIERQSYQCRQPSPRSLCSFPLSHVLGLSIFSGCWLSLPR